MLIITERLDSEHYLWAFLTLCQEMYMYVIIKKHKIDYEIVQCELQEREVWSVLFSYKQVFTQSDLVNMSLLCS